MGLTALDRICCFLSELMGTAILVFLGCMGCIKTDALSNDAVPNNSHLQISLNVGLVVMIAIQCFGCISGAHINPAITVAAFIYNLVSLPMTLVYIIAQTLGAIIGYGLVMGLVPYQFMKGTEPGVCVTVPATGVSMWSAFGIEFIITAILILVCCGAWDPRNAKFQDSTAIRIGLAITCLVCTAGPFTGASMNPARSLAPALWNRNFKDHWIYWAAPLSASAITSFIYKIIFWREEPKF